MLNRANRLNDFSRLPVTKLGILGGIEEILVCTSNRHNGKQIDGFPLEQSILGTVEAVYEVLTGRDQDISRIKRFDDLPIYNQDYVKFFSDSLNIEAPCLSVGPGREQFINRLDL
jgi:adenylosuccinate synthase